MPAIRFRMLVVASLAVVGEAAAQAREPGRVISGGITADGRPVAGATVEVLGRPLGVDGAG